MKNLTKVLYILVDIGKYKEPYVNQKLMEIDFPHKINSISTFINSIPPESGTFSYEIIYESYGELEYSISVIQEELEKIHQSLHDVKRNRLTHKKPDYHENMEFLQKYGERMDEELSSFIRFVKFHLYISKTTAKINLQLKSEKQNVLSKLKNSFTVNECNNVFPIKIIFLFCID